VLLSLTFVEKPFLDSASQSDRFGVVCVREIQLGFEYFQRIIESRDLVGVLGLIGCQHQTLDQVRIVVPDGAAIFRGSFTEFQGGREQVFG
jgi:hypothetical protein